jgi:hypothetical protein
MATCSKPTPPPENSASYGFVGFLEGGLVTGIAWALFGAAAGVLYGLWVGRTISARRLRPIAPLLLENTSSLVAWTDAPPNETTLAALAADAERECLFLSFSLVRGARTPPRQRYRSRDRP